MDGIGRSDIEIEGEGIFGDSERLYEASRKEWQEDVWDVTKRLQSLRRAQEAGVRNSDGVPNAPVVAPPGYYTQPPGPWSAWPWGSSESQSQGYRQRRKRSSSPG